MIGSFFAFDIIVAGVVVISALLALARGFFREVLSLISWVAAFMVTLYGFDMAAEPMRNLIGIPGLADVITGVVLFVVSLFVFSLLSALISSWVQQGKLGPVDRSLGFLFGFMRGSFIVCLFYLLVSFVIKPADQPDWIKNAKLIHMVGTGSETIHHWVPDAWWEKLGTYAQKLEGSTKQSLMPKSTLQPGQSPDDPNHTPSSQEEQTGGENMFDKLTQPSIQKPSDTENKGYSDEDRNKMNKILESTSGAQGENQNKEEPSKAPADE